MGIVNRVKFVALSGCAMGGICTVQEEYKRCPIHFALGHSMNKVAVVEIYDPMQTSSQNGMQAHNVHYGTKQVNVH